VFCSLRAMPGPWFANGEANAAAFTADDQFDLSWRAVAAAVFAGVVHEVAENLFDRAGISAQRAADHFRRRRDGEIHAGHERALVESRLDALDEIAYRHGGSVTGPLPRSMRE
jgi:hypothetical protein